MPSTTVTVSNATPQRIIDLIRAVPTYANTKAICSQLMVRGDDANAANNIFQGDATLTSTNYGIKLGAGASQTWSSSGSGNAVDLSNKYLLASAAATKADLSWEVY